MNTRFCLLTAAAALLTGISALAQGPDGIPDPKTVFDIPEHWYECPLGLPKNDEGERPGFRRPPKEPAYCAYVYDELRRSKVFHNGAGRIYSVTFSTMGDGSRHVSRSLAIADSLAIYMIDETKKTITKMPMPETQEAVTQFDKSRTVIKDENDIASAQDRWCYEHYAATKTVSEFAGHESEEVISHTTWTDLETGILLMEDAPRTRTRNIHIGLFHPEVYEFPKGYTFQVMDIAGGMKKMEDLEKRVENFEKTVKEMDLGNKSLGELLNLLK